MTTPARGQYTSFSPSKKATGYQEFLFLLCTAVKGFRHLDHFLTTHDLAVRNLAFDGHRDRGSTSPFTSNSGSGENSGILYATRKQ